MSSAGTPSTRASASRASAPCRTSALFASLPESALDHLAQLLGELVTRDEDGGLRRNAGLVEIAERQTGSILAVLLRLIADSPVDSLSRLSNARRTFDKQPPDALGAEPPKQEPLDDLAQPFLGFLGREEGGTGARR